MEAHAASHAHDHEHGEHPPAAHVSSRVDSRVLGMLLFIGSEIMLFGSFFTAYFFVRVVNGYPWPPEGDHLPVFIAGVNTVILVTSSFTMHWALQSIKRGHRAGLQAGLVLTFLMGLTFLLTQIAEYARVGFAPSDNAFGTIFYCLTGLHGAHVFVGLSLLMFATIRAFRGHYSPSTTTASSCRASTGTSSTSCGSSSTRRLHHLRDGPPEPLPLRSTRRFGCCWSRSPPSRWSRWPACWAAWEVGLPVWIVVTVAAIWWYLRPLDEASEPQASGHVSAPDERRILVIANETVAGTSSERRSSRRPPATVRRCSS